MDCLCVSGHLLSSPLLIRLLAKKATFPKMSSNILIVVSLLPLRAARFVFIQYTHDRDMSVCLPPLLIAEGPGVHMTSPLQHGQWHMAAEWPQASASQLSPELVQWVEEDVGWGS